MKETAEIKMFANGKWKVENGKWKMGMTGRWKRKKRRTTEDDEETRG